MTWNHRVWNLKNQNLGEDYFVVKETYYNEKNEVIGSGDLTVGGDSLKELEWIAEQIINSIKKPILDEKETDEENNIISDLISHFEYNKTKIVDLSDVGNEIGIAIGKFISDKMGFEIESLISGIKHGVSLVKGTHV